MATYDQCFTGRVMQREYSSSLEVGWSGTNRFTVIQHTVEQTFRFEGLTESQANGTTAQTVTDASGTQWTVPFKSSFTDGSSGYAACMKEQVDVQREQMSPHMYRVTVTRRGSKLVQSFQNGTQNVIFAAPTWAQGWL